MYYIGVRKSVSEAGARTHFIAFVGARTALASEMLFLNYKTLFSVQVFRCAHFSYWKIAPLGSPACARHRQTSTSDEFCNLKFIPLKKFF
jgi:hypothetical protein